MTHIGKISRADTVLLSGRLCALAVSILPLTALGSCASYVERTRIALGHFQRGELHASIEEYSEPDTTKSDFLAGAETGMVALAAGEWGVAVESLTGATKAVEEVEERALVSPERAGEQLLSWTLSETWLPYSGEGYERVQVHACLALAYLAHGLLDDVYVEVRRSNDLLESEEKLYEKEYRAGGLGHFVSAVTYELLGEPDEAYIDYRRMEEKGVGAKLAGAALARLAGELRYGQERDDWIEKYGDPPPLLEDAASIVVIAGVGLSPFKTPTTLPIPTNDGLLVWSIPDLVDRPQPVSELVLSLPDSGTSVRTVIIEDVASVSHENLNDRILWLAAKSAVRAVLKRELTRHLEDKHGGWGRLVGDLFTLFTERADLRSWQTLPDTWQAARMFVPEGIHRLEFEAVGGERTGLGAFELEAGETMFVLARTVGPRLFTQIVGGIPVGDPPTETAGPVPESRPDP